MCRRKCIYRGESGLCYYHLRAGKTKLAQIYEQRGSDVFTEEQPYSHAVVELVTAL